MRVEVWEALYWGLLSAVSFPIGAAVGIRVEIPPKLLVSLMSFGAGALFFALSIELFGNSVHEMQEHKLGKAEVAFSMGMSVLGALSFILMNRVLGSHEVEQPIGDGEPGEEPEHSVLQGGLSSPAAAGVYSTVDDLSPRDSMALVEPSESVQLQDKYDEPPSSGGQDIYSTVPDHDAEPDDDISPFHALETRHTLDETELQESLARVAHLTSSESSPNTTPVSSSRTRSLSTPEPTVTHDLVVSSNLRIPASVPLKPVRLTLREVTSSSRPLAAASILAMMQTQGNDAGGNSEPSTESHTQQGGGAAMAIWLGLTMDGVPEAMVIGMLANSGEMSVVKQPKPNPSINHLIAYLKNVIARAIEQLRSCSVKGLNIYLTARLSPALVHSMQGLIFGVFLANLPEAIATAAMMQKSGMSWIKNMMLWSSLCLMTGVIAMITGG